MWWVRSRPCGCMTLYFHSVSFCLSSFPFLLLPHMLPVCWAYSRGSWLISWSREVTMFRIVLKVDNADGVRCSLFSHHGHCWPALTLRAELEDFIVETTATTGQPIVITTLEIKCYCLNPNQSIVFTKKQDVIVNADCFWNINRDRQPSRKGPPAGLGLGKDLRLIRDGRIEWTPASSYEQKLKWTIGKVIYEFQCSKLFWLTLFPFAKKLAQAWSDLAKFSDGRSLIHPLVSYTWTLSILLPLEAPPVMINWLPSGIPQAYLVFDKLNPKCQQKSNQIYARQNLEWSKKPNSEVCPEALIPNPQTQIKGTGANTKIKWATTTTTTPPPICHTSLIHLASWTGWARTLVHTKWARRRLWKTKILQKLK